MISKNDILKFVKHVHRREQGIPDRRLMHPRREWLIGLLVFILVVTFGAVYSLKTFDTYKNIDKKTYTVDIQVPSYNKNLAQVVLADFALKEAKYNELAGNVAVSLSTPEVEVATTTEMVSTSTVATTTPEEILQENDIEAE